MKIAFPLTDHTDGEPHMIRTPAALFDSLWDVCFDTCHFEGLVDATGRTVELEDVIEEVAEYLWGTPEEAEDDEDEDE